jgi:2-oxo-4-hydroxy-4-carboxy-5-ureidoimidazoline decarboxylase
LVATFRTVSDELDEAGVLALLRAHPQLAAAGPMTTSSRSEQRSAGLTDLDDATRARIVAANARYRRRFGFPFIVAVRGLTPSAIAAALDDRLTHDDAEERATALAQVQRIAELRIDELMAP